MWIFYPSEGLPKEIDLLESKITKLEYWSAQLWHITKGTELIQQILADSGSRGNSIYGTIMGVEFRVALEATIKE